MSLDYLTIPPPLNRTESPEIFTPHPQRHGHQAHLLVQGRKRSTLRQGGEGVPGLLRLQTWCLYLPVEPGVFGSVCSFLRATASAQGPPPCPATGAVPAQPLGVALLSFRLRAGFSAVESHGIRCASGSCRDFNPSVRIHNSSQAHPERQTPKRGNCPS